MGILSKLFRGVVVKQLAPVEVDAKRSNQHEFNGSKPLIELFGKQQPQRLQTDFYRMSRTGKLMSASGMLTWYDARARHPTRSEYRLYYYDNSVTRQARAGDTLLIGRKFDGSTFLLTAPSTGAAASRIAWLFSIEIKPGAAFAALDLDRADKQHLSKELQLGLAELPAAWEAETDAALKEERPEIRSAVRELQRKLSQGSTSDTPFLSQEGEW
ncbi:hypothetical protein FJN17_07540 [Bradyrhizobium symbiodeficiens]|uniref:Restriction endonuclease subunit S n=1 Tax=Bradyrhizobium symbiodeficiens TaxID=1404367 RepID=A0ABX5W2C5_9BRAD|nr:hypothetical protein [Bradyrhizobium symbiodeficiens]QDF37437.1 hypothetical protein FJN17_07540 [Bradyrhizobium symbiodeficiens]